MNYVRLSPLITEEKEPFLMVKLGCSFATMVIVLSMLAFTAKRMLSSVELTHALLVYLIRCFSLLVLIYLDM